ncbi:MAG: hypothetical protein HY321_21415 [Armatimonadetes bacterium]|nr:hypothetical protein [Armatimonadota bacterium]
MPSKVDQLARDLRSWLPRRVRAAAEQLVRSADARAIEALQAEVARACRQGETPFLRLRRRRLESICRALGGSGSRKAVGPLVNALGDWDARVRLAAARALARMPAIASGAVGPLIGALQDSDARVCELAALALGGIGDRRALGPLIRVLGDRPADAGDAVAGRLDHAAGDALAALGAPLAVPLVRALRDHGGLPMQWWVRKCAERAGDEALGSRADAGARSPGSSPGDPVTVLADKRLLPVLVWLLAAVAPRARHAVIGGWVALGVPVADDLARLLRHPSLLLRLWVSEALWELEGPELEPRLARPGGGSDPGGRLGAAFALGSRGFGRQGGRVHPDLLAGLESAHEEDRLSAAVALARLGDPSGLGILEEALDRECAEERWEAARAIERLGIRAGPALVALHRRLAVEGERAVRIACLGAIAHIRVLLRDVPAELEAARDPEGVGTELEAAQLPDGRGTELEAGQAPDGRGTEPEAAAALRGFLTSDTFAGPSSLGGEGETPGRAG